MSSSGSAERADHDQSVGSHSAGRTPAELAAGFASVPNTTHDTARHDTTRHDRTTLADWAFEPGGVSPSGRRLAIGIKMASCWWAWWRRPSSAARRPQQVPRSLWSGGEPDDSKGWRLDGSVRGAGQFGLLTNCCSARITRLADLNILTMAAAAPAAAVYK